MQEEHVEAVASTLAYAASVETVASVRIIDEEGDDNNFVVLSAAQTRARSIRTQTQREALDMLSGVNLREVLEQTASNSCLAVNDARAPAAKRARANFDDGYDDIADGNDACLTLIDAAASSVVFNDEF